MPQKTPDTQLLRGGALVTGLALLASPLGYLIRVVLSRSLTVEMYGLFYAMLSFIGIFTTYNDLGFGYALSYLVPKFIRRRAFGQAWLAYHYERTIELVTAGALSIGLVLLAPWLARSYFKVPQGSWLLIIFCGYFLANSYVSALHKFFLGLRQEKVHSLVQPAVLAFTLVGLVMCLILGQKNVFAFALSWTGGYVLTGLLFSFLNGHINSHLTKQHVRWDSTLFKQMLRLALPTIMTSTIFTFITSMDTVFLTIFHGVTAVGVFNIILPLAAIPAVLFSPLDGFIYPHISHLADGERTKISEMLTVTQKMIIWITLYFGTFIALYPEAIVRTLFGEQWVIATGTGLRLYACTFVLFALSSHYNSAISGMGQVAARLRASLWLAILNATLGAFLIWRFGVLGAVAANIAVSLAGCIFFLHILRREVAVTVPVRYLGTLLLQCISLAVIFFGLKISPVQFGEVVLVGVVYSVLFVTASIFGNALPFPLQNLQAAIQQNRS